MFNNLTKNFSNAFAQLLGRDKIRDADFDTSMRDIRIALLEADVALPVVKELVDKIRARAIGEKIIDGVKAGEQIVKIFSDEITAILGGENKPVAKSGIIMMAGLNGTGKTTSAAKLAALLKKDGAKVLLASADTYRPQAREQLAILAEKAGIDSLPIIENETPEAIAKRALKAASNYDVMIFDTAGRLHIDDEMMTEIKSLKKILAPTEILLTIDAFAGQDALTLATQFNEALSLTGAIITRMDGDARGGVALSLFGATNIPVKFVGTGEKIDDLEAFHPDRTASRILGMGDIVSLVETAQEKIDDAEAERIAEQMFEGAFTFDTMLDHIRQIKKLGSASGIIKFLPGIGGLADRLQQAGMNDDSVKKQEAMILSMTKSERRNPDIILMGRKKRIAAGAGVSVNDVEKLIKQFEKSKKMMSGLKSMGGVKGIMEMMKNMQGGQP
ncbi:MAG: signal recognition particle protein [Alphaproteobacteria bacterium]|nr:signal recognition particle protein [Alphaproteobacteria bacterium]